MKLLMLVVLISAIIVLAEFAARRLSQGAEADKC
jgi:hypothetical protein